MKTPGSPPGDRLEVEAQQCVQLTSTNQSESYLLLESSYGKAGKFRSRSYRYAVFREQWHAGFRARRSPPKVSGAYSGGDTPVPIPNTAVKPAYADGTQTAGSVGE